MVYVLGLGVVCIENGIATFATLKNEEILPYLKISYLETPEIPGTILDDTIRTGGISTIIFKDIESIERLEYTLKQCKENFIKTKKDEKS